MIHRLHDPLKKRQPGPLVPNVLALSVALAFAPAAIALPSGESVVSGSVAVGRPDDRNMVVQQGTSKAIVNWQSFSIGGNESVAFRQPGASSAILNRVVGSSPSDIFGRMTANGQVFLVNPRGVFFAPGASVDVAGLVASTLNITDADFLSGRYRFGGGGTQGSVSNRGSLQAAQGGTVALLGGQVSNDGTIAAQLGTVALVAGSGVTLDFAGDGLTKITVDEAAVGAQVRNSGMIVADGGLAVLTAYAAQALADTVINQEGLVRARSLGQRNGRILLDGGEAGATLVSGSLDASGTELGQTGGTVSVLGHHVGVTDQASIDAGGSAGGGTVLIGGDYQGSNPAVRNAAATYFGPQASIKADALQSGNGGKVILWSDGPTRAYGTISARGGTGGGDGGLVETSGHWLDVAGARVSAAAPAGVAGSWLLDPGDIAIVHSDGTGSILGAEDPSSVLLFSTEASSGGGTVSDHDINAALNAGTNVTVRAEMDNEDSAGDITVNGTAATGGAAQILNSSGGARTLSLIADGNVFVDPGARIAGTGGGNALGLTVSAQGGIEVNGAQILTNGGNVSMFGAAQTESGGIDISSSTIDAGTGQISLLGRASGTGVALGCGEDCDTVITTSGPNGAILIAGQSTGTSGGTGIEAGGDVTIGGPLTAGNIVLQATNEGSGDSIDLDDGGSARIQTTGVINLRPGGVSAAGALTDAANTPIDVGSTGIEASGFLLSPGDLGGIQPGYAALVIGSDQHLGQIVVSGDTTFSGSVTLQNAGSGGSPGGILLNAPLTSPGTVVLASSGAISQGSGFGESPNAPITAPALLVHAPNSSVNVLLDNPNNRVNSLAVDPPASFSFFNNGPLTIGALTGTGFSAASNAPTSISVTDSSSFGQFFVYAAGNLTLNRSISTLGPNSSSGPSIELVTEGVLTNNAGAGALSPSVGGNWIVWANTFVGETRGGLDPGNAQPNLYGCTYPGNCVSGVSIPSTGNRFIYEQQPSVTVFADDQLRAFGTANPPLTFTPVGLVNGDTVADALSGTLTTSATQFSPIGLYPITEAIPFTSPVGYVVAFDPGRLGVEGLAPPHHGDDAAAGFGETYLYERNIGLPPMCLASGPLVPEAGTQGTELLDLEWSRIRLKPNVTNCIAVSEGNTCKSF